VDLNPRFQKALEAIDAGDADALEILLQEHPALATDRLRNPGEWLREKIGGALDGLYKDPYLLWFVSEDIPRAGKLPPNIVSLSALVIQTARNANAESLQEQLDSTLQLVAWSGIAKECGVQLGLMDLLIDEGAALCSPNLPLVNGHLEAANKLIERGAELTLACALLLDHPKATELTIAASHEKRQGALILCSLYGKADALRTLIEAGVNLSENRTGIYEHGTALHHAVWSGNVEAVKVLVEAGADRTALDKAFKGTPLGWAEYGERIEVAKYLRSLDN